MIFHLFLRKKNFSLKNFHNFFHRLQPNLQTRDKQLKSWSRLVLDYCQFNKIYSANFEEISNSELFNNRRLNSLFLFLLKFFIQNN